MSEAVGLGPYSQDCLDLFNTLELDPSTIDAMLEAKHGEFTAIGNVQILGEPVAAGIKKRQVYRLSDRVAEELYVAGRLLDRFPQDHAAVPFFTFPVVRPDHSNHVGGGRVGILTEDFTRNGLYVLEEQTTKNDFGYQGKNKRGDTPEGLHRDVYDALDGRVHAEAFRHMTAFVFDREVLIDFHDVAYPSESTLEEYRKLVEAMTVTL